VVDSYTAEDEYVKTLRLMAEAMLKTEQTLNGLRHTVLGMALREGVRGKVMRQLAQAEIALLAASAALSQEAQIQSEAR